MLSLFVLLAAALAHQSHAISCVANFSGVTYDLSPLIAANGSYTWVEKSFVVTDNNIYTGDSSDLVAYTYELQVCGAVRSAYPGCKPGSAINRIDSTGKCFSLGAASVAAFSPNPYQDGVFLAYYNGDDINHIQKYSARIYFVCDSTHDIVPANFEHEKSFYQSHFKIGTKYACAP